LDEKLIKLYIKKFRPYLESVTKKYSGSTYFSKDDIISAGNMAIVNALESTQGKAPTIYIKRYIDNCIKLAYTENGNLIALKYLSYSKDPAIKKINKILSLDMIVSEEKDDGVKLQDIIKYNYTSPDEKMIEEERTRIVFEELMRLPEKQRDLIINKYIFDKTYYAAGKEYGVNSRQRAQQIVKEIINKLKFMLCERGIEA